MCDYSLHYVVSRPARVGDKLVSTSFPQTTTRGFASVDDRNVAVCLLSGTELAFEEEVRFDTGIVFSRSLGHTVAKFQEINKDKLHAHHDALEFPDGKIVLLTPRFCVPSLEIGDCQGHGMLRAQLRQQPTSD